MNIAFFGGTFDPIHVGHLAAARAASRRFRLQRVLFVPAARPPHKRVDGLSLFEHRFAMVSIACAGEPRFVPSLLEAPAAGRRLQYSVETVRELKSSLGRRDHLYFLIGVDAFLDLPHWKQPERLLDQADFIVVSRPGFRVEDILNVIPRRMIRAAPSVRRSGAIALRRSSVHVLNGVDMDVASTNLRAALREGRRVAGLTPPLVEEYILKEGVYRN